jgi:hypothetical protein
MRKYTERELRKKAKKAVDAFMKSGADLNDTISAMVDKDDLSDHHVARICEMANHETRGRLFKDKSVDQSRVVFPAAKSVEIIRITRKPEVAMEHQKEASARYSVPDEYFQPPRQVILSAQPQQSDLMEKTASARLDVMKSKLRSIDMEYTKVASDARSALREFGARRADFFKQAAHDLRFGVANAEQVVAMVGSVDDGENGAYDLFVGNLPLMKEAMPIDSLKGVVENMKEYINPDIKAKYVLGDAPLLIKFKGMVGASSRVRDKVRYANELHTEYSGIEKIITQADLGDGSNKEIPKVAGMPGKKLNKEGGNILSSILPSAKTTPMQSFRNNMSYGPLDLVVGGLEFMGNRGQDTAHFKRMEQASKDPFVASGYLKELAEKNPESVAKFKEKGWDSDRWLRTGNMQRARQRKRAKDAPRNQAVKVWHDTKERVSQGDMPSYEQVMDRHVGDI